MSNVENLNSAENKMLRTLQAHGKAQPGVPYHADGEELGVIRDLRKKGLVIYTEPSHPHERYGYALSGAGMVAVDALTEIQHPPAQETLHTKTELLTSLQRKTLILFSREPAGFHHLQDVRPKSEIASTVRTLLDLGLAKFSAYTTYGASYQLTPEGAMARQRVIAGYEVRIRLDDAKAEATIPEPDAWRYKYVDGVEESKVWTYTEDKHLVMLLREREDYIIQKLDVRKEEE